MGVALLFVVTLALLVWGTACAYLYAEQGRLLYPGDGRPFGPFEALHALRGEAISTELDGQALRYYRVPPTGDQAPKAWVLLFHGNRDGARERLDFAQHLSHAGYATVLAEYPGYAGDAQRADQRLLLRNALSMADEAKRLAGGAPLFIFGESLGTAVATHTVLRRGAKGLFLSTPFTSLAAVAQARYPWMPVHALIHEPMASSAWAPHVGCPVLIIHGRQDKTVPYAEGVAQAKNFPRPPELVSIDGPGHSDIRDRFPEAYWGNMLRFLDRCLAA